MTTSRPLPEGFFASEPFRVASARAAGIGPGRLRGRDLTAPFHGVRAGVRGDDGFWERCQALACVLSPHQVFSHVTAARIHGMPLPPQALSDEQFDVLTLGTGRMRRPRVRGRQTLEESADVVARRGLPVVSPLRTWSQLAELGAGERAGIDRRWLVAIGDWLISGTRIPGGRTTPHASISQLRSHVAGHEGRRGARDLRWAADRVRAPIDSPRETLLRLALVDGGLPEPEVQVPVRTSEGMLHADLGYRRERLLLEYQGDEHRTSRRRWLRDLTRRQLFEDAGYRLIEVGADDVDDPAPLVGRVRRALGGG
jgi:very-short-patch-repair endonuclease